MSIFKSSRASEKLTRDSREGTASISDNNVVYHYTDRYRLLKILNAGYLKLSESNLQKPINMADARPKPDSELYKPVVWMTRSNTPQGNGLELFGTNQKHEIRITLRKRDHYEPWVLWSRNNRINKSWAKRLESVGNPYNWYISDSKTKKQVLATHKENYFGPDCCYFDYVRNLPFGTCYVDGE